MKHTHIRGPLAAAVVLALGAALAGAAVTGGDPSGGTGTDVSAPDGTAPPASGTFTKRVVTTGLNNPYEIVRVPDGALWVTEKSGKKVTRVDPKSGAKATLLSLPEAVHSQGGQDGVLGLAVEERPGNGELYAYLAYSYDIDPTPAVQARTKIERYTYDAGRQRLHSPKTVIAGMPSGSDHQSARVRLGPDGKLYYTIGDQGTNQFANFCRPSYPQRLPTAHEVQGRDWIAYQGKTLRLNTDGSVPADNPSLDGVRSHVYTYGHRNAQGLAFGPDGTLYQNDQGPKTDDEINVLRKGANYGWPNVSGYRDDKAYVYGNWSASWPTPCDKLTFSDFKIPETVPVQRETDFDQPFVQPVHTFGTVDSGFDFQDPRCAKGEMWAVCWPTIAPSSFEHYGTSRESAASSGGGIPGWRNSLLMTTLKDGSVYRVDLAAGGQEVSKVTKLFQERNRFRDSEFSADGRSLYVATDTAGPVRDAQGAPATGPLENPGAIIEYRWRS
ncbi:quinoprotein glucose dehydrogenase [Streptomyces sp. SID4919]|uniref:glucose/sorbosone family PQQ-dependent dehydrogenase n=1 Tax=unclassified Streptomyces TaxID=2593676 RepID=UPI000823857E|nr:MULTISPECIES: glucose/sorbosone family PQQ-dependent dehydrogenase [unclassified Streptomyces]MYY10661.1 quinoprotein glucose dehydrogenase [Streptomyces sp. SID4919]SCK62903.1 dehydrogenase, PQQ-dependent, s-GDH family [Streptomyces sp. AmelKG-E11A]